MFETEYMDGCLYGRIAIPQLQYQQCPSQDDRALQAQSTPTNQTQTLASMPLSVEVFHSMFTPKEVGRN